MGYIGRYIDSRTPEQKDFLVEAPRFIAGQLYSSPGVGCLVGHAEGYVRLFEQEGGWTPTAEAAWSKLQEDAVVPHLKAVVRFNKAIVRWPDRLTRAIKMRAGAKVDLPVEVAV